MSSSSITVFPLNIPISLQNMKILCLLLILLVFGDTKAGTFAGLDNVDSIEEGSCAPPFPEANVNVNFVNERQPIGGFYLGFNSQLQALRLAEVILGRNVTKDDDPQNYCLRLDWKTSEDGMIDVGNFHGFGTNASLVCQRLDVFGNKRSSQIEKNGKLVSPTAYWTLTDQESYVVTVICDGNQKKSWTVISTKPIMEAEVMEEIRTHVQKLGFNPSLSNIVDYSSCPD